MSARRRRRSPAVVLVLLVSLTAGVLAGTLPGHHPTPEPDAYDQAVLAAAAAAPPGDRVQAAIESVEESGFHIGPELRGELSADEVSRIRRIIDDSPTPLFVIWWERTRQAGYSPESAIDQVRAGVFSEGFYAVLSPGERPQVEALGYEPPRIEADGTGRPGAALTRLVANLAGAEAVRPGEPRADSDYWGGAGGGFAAGLLFAVLAYLGLLLVVGLMGVVAMSGARRGVSTGARPGRRARR